MKDCLFCFISPDVLFIEQLSAGDHLPRSVHTSQEKPPVSRMGASLVETLIKKSLVANNFAIQKKLFVLLIQQECEGNQISIRGCRGQAIWFVSISLFVFIFWIITKLEESI